MALGLPRLGLLPLGYNARSLWARKTTTVATVGGVAAVVAVFAMLFPLLSILYFNSLIT